jgi:hypothetical protein
MDLSRRSLLGLLAASVVDPERLLWVSGKKLISIPKPRLFGGPGSKWFCVEWVFRPNHQDVVIIDGEEFKCNLNRSDATFRVGASAKFAVPMSAAEIARSLCITSDHSLHSTDRQFGIKIL